MTDLIEAARTALDALDGSADFADMMAYVDTATEIRDAASASTSRSVRSARS